MTENRNIAYYIEKNKELQSRLNEVEGWNCNIKAKLDHCNQASDYQREKIKRYQEKEKLLNDQIRLLKLFMFIEMEKNE